METLKRLPFRLPDFTRLSWTSDRARASWEPRLRRISDAWFQIEWLSVADGVRPCCLLRMSPARFLAETPRWAERKVSALGVAREAVSASTYSSNTVKAAPGWPYVLCVGLGKPVHLKTLKGAFDAYDNETVGKLLGYPECCRKFFHKIWVQEGYVDTTWPMVVNSVDKNHDATCIEVAGPFLANILWRWMGVRAVPHLPCSFGCSASVALAEELRAVGVSAGFRDELAWLEEILSWPVEWSALHGIAEIKTPILKVSARTDATRVKYVVRRNGERYPDEGPTALRFPYRTPAVSLIRKRAPERRFPDLVQVHAEPPEWYYRDNGFGSARAMDVAHVAIVDLAVATLGEHGGAVLDLGCGNGVLLKKIRDRIGETVVPFGLDVGPIQIGHARDLFPGFSSNFQVGNMFLDEELWQSQSGYRLVILGVRRLLEVPPESAARLRQHLQKKKEHLLAYVFASADDAGEDLEDLAARAGLRLTVRGAGARVALAEAV